ncbi:MAG: barstar family protein [Clostridia bacterium]|nr:barstar family protein [Clostridia bacterium]
MKKICLDFSNIQTVRAAHIYIRYMMDLPAYYGCNLDALHDVLTELGEDTVLSFCGAERAGEEMQRWLPAFERVLADSAKENPHLTIG